MNIYLGGSSLGGSRKSGPLGHSGELEDLDDGTMIRAPSPRPGSIGIDDDPTRGSLCPLPPTQVFLSPVFRDTVQVISNMTAPMAWDSYWRMAYDRADKVLQAQANELLKRGNITKLEFDELVKARNTYKRDIYVGDFLCLAILAAGGRVFEINEASPGWKEAGDAIQRFLPGSLPHDEWTLRLTAVSPGESVPIYLVTRTG